MKYAILTFGCRTNQADSFEIERDLRARRGEASAIESADLVVVNTCAVTAAAEQAARQTLRRIARTNPRARVVATGCYATRQGADLRALGAWRIVPNDDKRSLATAEPGGCSECLDRESSDGALDFHCENARAGGVTGATGTMPGPGTGGRTVHLLRVQTGCDETCAYCVVPATRGRSRSLPLAAAMQRVSEAAAAGFREVILTGVHLGAYGRDLDPRLSLADLLAALGRHPADVRFRVSAVEPMDFDRQVMETVAASDRFARHFHLPLQHASDRVLRAMGRPYTLEQYDATIVRLSDMFPDAALGTDLIVGFPGETQEDFDACVRYLAASRLAYVHVFPFSPRPGTRAAALGGRPRGEVVRARVQQVREIGSQLGRRFRQRFAGTEREGLTIEDGATVLTDNYLRIRIPTGRPRNQRVRVRLIGDGDVLEGVPV